MQYNGSNGCPCSPPPHSPHSPLGFTERASRAYPGRWMAAIMATGWHDIGRETAPDGGTRAPLSPPPPLFPSSFPHFSCSDDDAFCVTTAVVQPSGRGESAGKVSSSIEPTRQPRSCPPHSIHYCCLHIILQPRISPRPRTCVREVKGGGGGGGWQRDERRTAGKEGKTEEGEKKQERERGRRGPERRRDREVV